MTEIVAEMSAQARAQIEAGRWVQAATLFHKMEESASLSPNENVYYGVALANLNKVDKALHHFTDSALASPTRRNFVRRRAVVPQLQIKNYSNAEAVLQRLLEIAPDNVANLGSLATVFLREEKDADALRCLRRAYALNCDSAALRNRLLQTYVRMGNVNDACEFALKEKHHWTGDPRFAQTCAVALLNANRASDALGAADAILAAADNEAPTVALAAQIYLESGHPKTAMSVCRSALRTDIESADIRFIMAKASRAMGRDACFAIHHLGAGLILDESHLQSARMLGQLHLVTGDFKSAVSAFETAIHIDPKCMACRIDLGRTLHLLARYDHAADVFAVPLKKQHRADNWKPLAISTFLAAGRDKEADRALAAYRRAKSRNLPKTLAEGLENSNHNSESTVPTRRCLDWAWEMTRGNQPRPHPQDRPSWERAAQWGARADALISDWMECRPERIQQILDRIHINEAARDRIHSAMSLGKGAILAAPHLGPLSASPLVLRKLGVAHRWLAPVPHTSWLNRNNALISTSELSELDTSVEFFRALSRGFAVATPVDGALDPSAPTIRFGGRDIPFSDFAARAAFKYQSPSFFSVPVWCGRKIDVVLKQLPTPQTGETFEAFIVRWTDAFCAHLKTALFLAPENLRLRGGFWRGLQHVQ